MTTTDKALSPFKALTIPQEARDAIAAAAAEMGKAQRRARKLTEDFDSLVAAGDRAAVDRFEERVWKPCAERLERAEETLLGLMRAHNLPGIISKGLVVIDDAHNLAEGSDAYPQGLSAIKVADLAMIS